MSLRIYARFL
jgi:GTP cyclohydrolase IB